MEAHKLLLLSICSLSVHTVYAAVAIATATVSEDYPGACLDVSTGVAHNLSATWQMNSTCGQYACVERENTLYVTFETCGYIQASPPCYTVEDHTLEYPACCPRVVCESAERNEIDTDDYGHYTEDREEELYMMESYDTPQYLVYDVALPDDRALESPAEYAFDWEKLFRE